MPIVKTDEVNFKAALDLLAAQLSNESSLKNNFRKSIIKVHPDKNPSPDAINQFKTLNSLYETVQKYTESSSPSKAAKQDMAYTLKQLPSEVREALVNKVLSENPSINKQDLLNPVNFKVSNNYVGKAHNPLEGRSHGFAVNAENFPGLKEKFQDIKGDYLKTSILSDLQSKIENTSSKEELADLKQEIKQSPEYKVLATGQGLFTKITGIKTSSVKELESMLDEQENNIENSARPE